MTNQKNMSNKTLKQDKLVTVKTYDQVIMANLVKNKLELSGISCTLKDEHTMSVLTSLYSYAIGGVKIKVKQSDLEKALDIIENMKSVRFCLRCNEEISSKKYEKCEKCGYIEKKPGDSWNKKIMIALSLFSLIPFIGFIIGIMGILQKGRRLQGLFLFILSLVITYNIMFYNEIADTYIGGNKKQENIYEYGKLVKVLFWYKNGNKKSEISIKNNKRNGKTILYYIDGFKKEEEYYIDNKLEGKATVWYENGKKRAEINFKKGKQNGKSIFWNEDGSKKGENIYKNGVLIE